MFVFLSSLRSRLLEVVGERENGHARGKNARGEGAPARKAPDNHSLFPRVSPFRAPVFSRAHYFQASACYAGYFLKYDWARGFPTYITLRLRIEKTSYSWQSSFDIVVLLLFRPSLMECCVSFHRTTC